MTLLRHPVLWVLVVLIALTLAWEAISAPVEAILLEPTGRDPRPFVADDHAAPRAAFTYTPPFPKGIQAIE